MSKKAVTTKKTGNQMSVNAWGFINDGKLVKASFESRDDARSHRIDGDKIVRVRIIVID